MKLKLALLTLSLLVVLLFAQTTTNVMALELGETWTLLQIGTGVAEYSTEQAHTGQYSVKLATPVNPDQGRVRFPGRGETLSQVVSLSYWSYVATAAQGNDRLRPWIGIYLDEPPYGVYTYNPLPSDIWPGHDYYLQGEPLYATSTHDAPGNLANLGTWEYWDVYGGASPHPFHWLSYESPDLPYDAPHLQDYIDGGAISYDTAHHGTVSFASREYGSLKVVAIDFRAGYGVTWNDFMGYVDDVTINEHIVSLEPPNQVWVNDGWAGYSPGDPVDSHTFGYDAFDVIQDGINAVAESGTVYVAAGEYVEIGQIVIGKDLSIIGEDASTTTIKPSADTGSSGDARGWFLVQNGVTFNLESVTLDGSGHKVFQAVRHRGQGEVTDCIFKNIKFGESGPNYAGFGIVAFGDPGNVDVTDCEFSEIGRVGVLYFGSGITDSTFSGNEYTGKGVGDWLDYAVEVGAGAHVAITGNTISNNLGVASVDGSTSAGILVTTYYGPGSEAVITYNTISGCTDGIAVGYDDADTSAVTAHYNNIFGNAMGISSTAPTVDAEYNWWGNLNGPYDPLGTVEMPYEPEPSVYDMKNTEPVGDLGDEVSEYVDYYPWLSAPFEIYTALEDLKTEIDDLSDGDFKPPAADRTAALTDKINDVIAKIDAGDYQGAIMKLNMDIKPKLDYSARQAWLVTDHSELLDKIAVIVGILQGML